MKLKLYKDTIHGIHAECGSKAGALAWIKLHCQVNDLEVPTLDKIVMVKEQPKRKPKILLTQEPEVKKSKDLGGRPTKYKPEYDDQVYKLCLLGATDEEIANFFEVSESTINLWKLDHEKFSESIKRGKSIADGNIADRLYQRAFGFEHPDEEIKVVSMGAGMGSSIERVPVTKVYPPDTTAAIFWLKNRQSKKWREKSEVEQVQRISFIDDLDD